MEKLFFQLLQVAIGNRKELSHIPTVTEWSELFALSKKQALVGIAFAGVTKLNSASDYGTSLGMDEMTYLKWLGLMAKTQQRNKDLNAECARVSQELAHDGVRSVVLKGQSNLVYYSEELRECRTAGDIDLWCDVTDGVEVAHEVGGRVEKREYRGMEGVIEYCKQYERCQGREIPWHRVLYYHCELTSPSGIGIEPHYRPSYLNSPLRNWRLQRWFKENEQFGLCDFAPEYSQRCQERLCIFPIPTVSFNAVYQLLHIYKHLFEEGIGLRQLLDYYFVLRALHIEQGELADRGASKFTQWCQTSAPALSGVEGYKNERQSIGQWAEGMGVGVKSNAEIMHTITRFGMAKFASATMYVLQTVFAMPDVYLLCDADEREGRFLLDEIMQAGNFGKYDGRIKHGGSQLSHAIEKTKHNLRLIGHYPSEVLWEPIFRVYHWLWRKLELWRW